VDVISIRRISLGGGFRYLMESVAVGDGRPDPTLPLAAYYAASGTPPGRFLGDGLPDLGGGTGVAVGSPVSEEHLRRMLGDLADPLTGEPVGRRPNASAKQRPVAGFDLTFSPPKSVSVLWALADPDTQAVIYDCHRRAVAAVLDYAEQAVFKSRSGTDGCVEEDLRGVVATAFTHWESRAGDPQLHDHVVVWNRARSASDGRWRTLDSRALFKATVALSKLHNGVLADLLTEALGVGWEPRSRRHSDRPRFEIVGVEERLMAEFSRRAEQVGQAKDQLVERFVADHGRAPTNTEVLKLRQVATLATRPDKVHRSLREMTSDWRERAEVHVGPEARQTAWAAGINGRNDLPRLRCSDLGDGVVSDAAAQVLEAVSARRATFSRHNLAAEAAEVLEGVRFVDPAERIAAVDRVTGLALERSVSLAAPVLCHTPAAYLRPDGSSRLDPESRKLYTTHATLAAEARLLDAADDLSAPLAPSGAAALLQADASSTAQRILAPDQALAVDQIAGSGRVLDVLVGPAGSGKSTAMAALRSVWEDCQGPGSVVGLAPSAAAAQVLADELGIPCENTTKWLTEHRRLPELAALRDRAAVALLRHPWPDSPGALRLRRQLKDMGDAVDARRLRPGQLVIVDEASLAPTRDLDELVGAARAAGAKVLLVGDWAQLGAVGAGGAFGLLARQRGDLAPQLGAVRRFAEDWEAHASLQLRAGDTQAVTTYDDHGRVAGGDSEEMLDAVYRAWKADTAAGLNSLMIAADRASVDALNARARAELVAAGTVSAAGDGHPFGVGDRVVTRRNDRRLVASDGAWVRNGDAWTVESAGPNGSLTLRRAAGDGRVVVTPDYVQNHVDLAYATTVHRAQGQTVDTAHALVTPATSREALYVAATRGRLGNRLYVDTAWDPDPATGHEGQGRPLPTEVLAGILTDTSSESSAHEVFRRNLDAATSVRKLAAEYETIAAQQRVPDSPHHPPRSPVVPAMVTGDPDIDRALDDRLRLAIRAWHADSSGGPALRQATTPEPPAP